MWFREVVDWRLDSLLVHSVNIGRKAGNVLSQSRTTCESCFTQSSTKKSSLLMAAVNRAMDCNTCSGTTRPLHNCAGCIAGFARVSSVDVTQQGVGGGVEEGRLRFVLVARYIECDKQDI